MTDPASVARTGDLALDLSTARRVHIVGVGGAGMSAVAEVLAAMGHRVTGSDARDSAVMARLRDLGIEARVGHAAQNVYGAEVVAVSSAIGAANQQNPEVAEALGNRLPVLRRAEILAAIAALRRVLAVSGTHGKTTTSAMLAVALSEAGFDPSFLVGAPITGLHTGARWAPGEWLVAEADESDGTFLELRPEAAVVTSVEPDHLGHYGAFDDLVAAFERFVASVKGPCLVCADDEVASRLATAAGALSYGTSPSADYRLTGIELDARGTSFGLRRADLALGQLHVPVPGLHNALNAAGAAAVATEIGAPIDAVVRGLSAFPGVSRRFETRGEAGGVTFVDDYAHLPSEVSAALSAAKTGPWQRIVCVFQPHRYSRTADLGDSFAGAFAGADVLAVTEIYSAGEEPRPGISGKLIVDSVLASDPTSQVAWFPSRSDLVAFLEARLRPGDLCLTLGAGDLTTLPDELITALS